MATHIHIEGMAPYNGDYPFDVSGFTNRELHTIKQISGARAGELEEAFDADDNDLVVAFTVIALQRAGVKVDVNHIWDAPVGKVSLVIDDEEEVGADGPPPSAPPNAQDENAADSEKRPSSGGSSRNGGDHHQSGPSLTGGPSSDTSAELPLETSAK